MFVPVKTFLRLVPYDKENTRARRIVVKSKELKNWADALRESASNRAETAHILHSSMKGFTGELQSTQKLWRKGGNPVLIKVGLALIAFPDPTISDIIGSALVLAGLIHFKVRNSECTTE